MEEMLIGPNERAHLLSAMASNRCVLFTGAGFSRSAANTHGELSDAVGLAKRLWEFARLPNTYDGTALHVVYQAVLQSGIELGTLGAFLESHLLATDVPPYYDTMAKVFWRRIYTTNADNVVETVFRRNGGHGAPGLDVRVAPRHEYADRDQLLGRIQYVKLHGSIPGDPRDLTFGTIEFAKRASSRQDWWDHFVRDYVFNPTLFIGTQLDEPLFWQALTVRGPRGDNPEERPGSYLVSPSISPAKAVLLAGLNVTHVPATAQEFFDWLAREFTFPDRLAVLGAANPEAAMLFGPDQGDRTGARIDLFAGLLDAFERPVLGVPKAGHSARGFLRGAPPTWADLAVRADAPREFMGSAKAAVLDALSRAGEPSVVALLGEGGSGKSTALRRLAVSLATEGVQTFFSDGASRPDVGSAVAALDRLGAKACLVVDNAALFGPALAELVTRVKTMRLPPVVVIGSRYIPFEQRIRDVLAGGQFVEFDIPPLTDSDIREILLVLDQHNQLGHLIDLSPDDRRYEFKQRARKQLLVAMREATEGRGFDEIIQSEFSELKEREPRILFLCAALATAALVDLTEPQLFGCAEAPPAEVLRIMRRDLRGMLHESDRFGLVAARHPVIADYILSNVAGKEEVMEAYRRVLVSIARDIFPGAGRRTRSWRLFVRLVNHTAVYERFGEDIDHARGVYELTSDAFARDGHFWLQYANLEIDHGRAANARPLIANAEGLLGQTDLVEHTRAHMMLREALTVGSFDEAKQLRIDAEQILRHQMNAAAADDEYPAHIFLTHMLGWVRAWAPDRDSKKRELEVLIQLAREACKTMPRNTKLKGVYDALSREYLGLAVGGKSSSTTN